MSALSDKLFASALGAFLVFSVTIGHRLNLYVHLGTWKTSSELAALSKTNERYVREWLEHQAVNSIVEVEDESLDDLSRKYKLTSDNYDTLVNKGSAIYAMPLATLTFGALLPVDSVIEAFKTGGGVPFGDYGDHFRSAIADMNRPMFMNELGKVYIPSIPDIHAKLQQESKIVDVGCGFGWSSIGLALAYPNAEVDGVDMDQPSIDQANINLGRYGLDDRIKFHAKNASDAAFKHKYDLAFAAACIHDMSNPVKVLETMRGMLKDDGAVIIADEKVADTFSTVATPFENLMYGFSLFHCLAAAMTEENSAATGAIIRAPTLEKYALKAGFSRVEVLDIDNKGFRYYRLHQ